LKHTKSAGEPPQSPSEVAQAGIASIIAGKPPQNWAEDAALRGEMAELKRLLEDYRSDPGKTVLGARQMAWLADGVQAAVARGTRWQLVGQQTVLFDTFLDFDLALELQRAELSKLQAASSVDPRGKTAQEVSRLEAMLGAWEAVLHNVTGWGCGAVFCFGPQRTARIFDEDDPSYGQQVTVTPSVMARMRNLYASSKYEIPVGFDSWEGYTAERLDLLSALTPAAGAAVVYGGDSHNAWAGLVRSEPVGGGAARRGRRAAVCAEIDVTSTTSTGTQHFIPLLPAGLVEAALLAANRDRSFGHSECDESASGCNFRSSMRYTRMTGLRGYDMIPCLPVLPIFQR
jgi:alkaline phosphatase D